MRAVIYCRVSSDPKGRGRSVEEQETECRALCEREGWTVTKVIRDNDRSASRHAKRAREGWAEVIERIEGGKVDVLVTWEASRAQRDLAAYAELRELCARTRTRWSYLGTTYDLAERSDRFRTGLDALIAEDEADRTQERVKRAMRMNAAKGRPHGKLPFGYRRVYDEATREFVRQEIEPEQAALIREASRRFLAGESTRSIATDFNRRGIPSPRDGDYGWRLEQIRRLLTNPAYAARRVHQGEVIGKADWPAILDDETFDALTRRFEDPSRRTSRQSPHTQLLSGVARCGACGGPMSYAKQGGKDRKVRLTYSCRYKHCTARDMRALEQYVTDVVIERFRRPDARAALDGGPRTALATEAGERAAALRERLRQAVAEFTAGNLSASTLAQVEASLQPQIADAEREARMASVPPAARGMAEADNPEAAWKALNREQQRELLRALCTVVVKRVGSGFRGRITSETVEVHWLSEG